METFEIKVTQVETDVPTTKKEYEVIGVGEDGEHKYGYVNHDTTETVETVIYTQKMNELSVADLAVFLNRDQDRPFSSPTVAGDCLTAPTSNKEQEEMSKPTQAEDGELDEILEKVIGAGIHWAVKSHAGKEDEGDKEAHLVSGQAKQAILSLKSTWQAEVLDELYQTITPFSCKPNCTAVEHAYHQGSWDTIQNIEKAIDLMREGLER